MHVLGGQRIDSSHVTVAHSQAYVITDLCWHEQSVRVQRKGAFLLPPLCHKEAPAGSS